VSCGVLYIAESATRINASTSRPATQAVALLARMPLVLCHRFDPVVMLDAIRERRPTFTIGAVTVFTALLNTPGVDREYFRSIWLLYSGGAPISPTAAKNVEATTGRRPGSRHDRADRGRGRPGVAHG
jgi:acyl-CoA synthetase (AMP-forming)/AMP-acid ligase II